MKYWSIFFGFFTEKWCEEKWKMDFRFLGILVMFCFYLWCFIALKWAIAALTGGTRGVWFKCSCYRSLSRYVKSYVVTFLQFVAFQRRLIVDAQIWGDIVHVALDADTLGSRLIWGSLTGGVLELLNDFDEVFCECRGFTSSEWGADNANHFLFPSPLWYEPMTLPHRVWSRVPFSVVIFRVCNVVEKHSFKFITDYLK